MARRKDSPQKAAMRKMMRDYLKNNDISIKDTGVGMSEEFIKHKLFVPFVQEENSARSKYTGTGLGMPIVKQLVEKMGGTISVESKPEEGSCFKVVIPFKIDNSRKTEPISDDEGVNADISGFHILLVEDNELNMEIAEFMLEDCAKKEYRFLGNIL